MLKAIAAPFAAAGAAAGFAAVAAVWLLSMAAVLSVGPLAGGIVASQLGLSPIIGVFVGFWFGAAGLGWLSSKGRPSRYDKAMQQRANRDLF